MTATAAPTIADLDPAAILNAIPDPILVLDGAGRIRLVNPAAEEFFHAGRATLCRQGLRDVVPYGSPLLALVEQVAERGTVVTEYAVDLGTPRIGTRSVNIQVAPVIELPGHAQGHARGHVVVRLEIHSIANKMDRQLTHRGAARSLVAMAAVLAHEVKNPLSGIRGAAQLLEQNADAGDRELTRLICEETDRICALVDRMEMFSDPRPITRDAINIHRILEHVRKVAAAGFARHIRFVENYDPSLPPVHGNRDGLIQALLNLVKNAAEAAPRQGGEVVLTTAYRHGLRLSVPGAADRVRLPLEVSVADNGPGIAEDLKAHLFDPFVTNKVNGSGLGLALVAKIIGDHGGVIEAESLPHGALFRIHLPVIAGEETL